MADGLNSSILTGVNLIQERDHPETDQSFCENSETVQKLTEDVKELHYELAEEKKLVENLQKENKNLQEAREADYKKYEEILQNVEENIQTNFKHEILKIEEKLQCQHEKEIKNILVEKSQFKIENDRLKKENEDLKRAVSQGSNTGANAELISKFESNIIMLEEANRKLQDKLLFYQNAGSQDQVELNTQIHKEHLAEITKFQKEALKDSKKQLSEIKELQGIIGKLEKKLGFEVGTCLRLQSMKGELDNALFHVKVPDNLGRRTNIKGVDFNGQDFDIEAMIMELPPRLACKPHNDPERKLHRKNLELSALVRRLDEKNQSLAVKNEQLIEELSSNQEIRRPFEEKILHLGNKNMELNQTIRRLESKTKELQKDILEKDEKVLNLQQLVERKDKKLKKFTKKDKPVINADDYEDLQRQLCEQLQIIAELRQQKIETDRRMDVMRKGYPFTNLGNRRKSLSLNSLSGIDDSENYVNENIPTEHGVAVFEDSQGSIDDTHADKKRLAQVTKEYLELQRVYALLQKQSGEIKDPERSALQREALQSDLLVMQATVNEMEKKLEDKDLEQDKFLEEAKMLEIKVLGLEEKNDDLHQKLVSAESDLVQKTLQLKDLTEDITQLMDQNDLLEFKITEMEEQRKSSKTKPTQLRLTEEDRRDLSTDIDEVECDAVSVRIALKELEINKKDELTPYERSILTQARALVDKGDKELQELQESEVRLNTNLEQMKNMYSEAKQKLAIQEDELRKFRREKLKLEEAELLDVGSLTKQNEKVRKTSFDLTYGFEKNPTEMLADARVKIQELEYLNEILYNKINRLGGGKSNDLSEDELELLRQKIDRLRDAEKQINILQVSNDELFKRLQHFEEGKDPVRHSIINFEDLSPKVAQEIFKLKQENEVLSSELGTLRRRADDALALAKQAKDVLNKDDHATQTPSFEFLEFVSTRQPQQFTDKPLEIPELDPDVIEKNLVDETIEEEVLAEVQCLPYEHFSTSSMSNDSGSEVHSIPDEKQLGSDNEFIQSILREYENANKSPFDYNRHNESVIFRPADQKRSSKDHEDDAFDMYLNETIHVDTPRSSNGPLSTISTLNSAKSNFSNQNAELRSGVYKVDGHWSPVATAENKFFDADADRRMSSDCSTCGLTPRKIPEDIEQQLKNYQTNVSPDASENTTPRSGQVRSESGRRGSQTSSSTQNAVSTCSTCGMTPPHTPRLTAANSSVIAEPAVKRSMIPIRIDRNRSTVSRPSRPVFPTSPLAEEIKLLSEKSSSLATEDYDVDQRVESTPLCVSLSYEPPPYSDDLIFTQKKFSVANLPQIDDDVMHAIDNSNEYDMSLNESSHDSDIFEVDSDIKELLDYGKSIVEDGIIEGGETVFQTETFEQTESGCKTSPAKMEEIVTNQSKPTKIRPRSFSEPEIHSARNAFSYRDQIYEKSPRYSHRYEAPNYRLDSGIDSLPIDDNMNYHEDDTKPEQYDDTISKTISDIDTFIRETEAKLSVFKTTFPIDEQCSNYRDEDSFLSFANRNNAIEQENILFDNHLPNMRHSSPDCSDEETNGQVECQELYLTAPYKGPDHVHISERDISESVQVRETSSGQQLQLQPLPLPQPHQQQPYFQQQRFNQSHSQTIDVPQSIKPIKAALHNLPVPGFHKQQQQQPSTTEQRSFEVRTSKRELPSTCSSLPCQPIGNRKCDQSLTRKDLNLPTPLDNKWDTQPTKVQIIEKMSRRRHSSSDQYRQSHLSRRSSSSSPTRKFFQIPAGFCRPSSRSRSASPKRSQKRVCSSSPTPHFESIPLKHSRRKFPSDSELSRISDATYCSRYSLELGSPNVLRERLELTKTGENIEKATFIRNPFQCSQQEKVSSYRLRKERIHDLLEKVEQGIHRFGKRALGFDEPLKNQDETSTEKNAYEQLRLPKELKFLREQCLSLERQLKNRDQVIGTMQDELKDESDHIAIIEKKDKEIQLKTETIAQITQILEKTKKELQVRVVECNRRETEIKQLKVEMKNILNEKKKVEYSYSEQQITVSKLDATETRLGQMTVKCDELTSDNRELVERVKQLEISEREFIDLERNVIELQTQLRDMEDVEYHRDELMQKLNAVKRQRDEFLQKGKLVEEERNEFVKSNKTLEQYLIEWKRKTSEFKKTNQALKDRILSLERDKKELEDRVINIQQERTIMQTKISNLEMEREDYMRELREITLERNALEARLADYEDMLGDHDQLEEGFHSLRLKVAELTRQRDDLEIMIHSYKAKVQHLKRSVHERDEKILELSHEIKILKVSIDSDGYTHDVKVPSHRHHQNKKDRVKSFFVNGDENIEATKIYRPSDTDVTSDVDSYDMLPVRGVKYDTHTDESIVDDKYTRKRRAEQSKRRKYVALFDYDPYKSSASDHPERELRLKEGDYVTVYGEVDIDGYLEGEVDGISGLVPSVYVEELSDDDAQYASQRHHHHKSVTSSSNSTRYVVLYDYDPYTMGTTDRPDLQLSLRKGDVIIVYGSVNEEGYYTASLNGVRGLVPSNFVEEYSSYYASRHSQHHHHDNSDFHHFGNIEGTIEVEEIAGPPYAPRDLKVTRVVTSNAVLLSWQLPPMDEHYNSNGCRVVGYRLWINGKFKQDVKTATTTKVLLDDVDLRGRVEFSIQTIGEGDLCSEKCHFAITGALAAVADSNVKHGDNMYVALYDYDPFKSSPNPNPSLELAFREGDLMAVHDKTRSDGFYGAELNGRKGLVPSNFIERVSGKNVHQHHQHRSSQESEINRRVSFQPKKD